MSMTVKLWTRDQPSEPIILEHVDEIHWNYTRRTHKLNCRVAFESIQKCTGHTYPLKDVLEFEATEEEQPPIKIYKEDGTTTKKVEGELAEFRRYVRDKAHEWLNRGAPIAEVESALFTALGYALSFVRVEYHLSEREA